MQRTLLIGGLLIASFAVTPVVFAADYENSVDVVDNGLTGLSTQLQGNGGPFTVVSSVSFKTFKEATISVTSPNGGEQLISGQVQEITWDWQGDAITYVNLLYSKDNGAHYISIAKNVPNLGRYAWHVPDIDSHDMKILVRGSDLADVFVEDMSDNAFTVLGVIEYGKSPIDGITEELSAVDAGQVITSPSFSTFYFVTEDGLRRPFIDAQSASTYVDHAEEVVVVTDATIASFVLGAPMLAKPGVVLVKEVISPEVYLVDGDDQVQVLRLIADETVAISMFGEDWAEYVIDVRPTEFAWYRRGKDIDHVIMFDVSQMRKREDLAL